VVPNGNQGRGVIARVEAERRRRGVIDNTVKRDASQGSDNILQGNRVHAERDRRRVISIESFELDSTDILDRKRRRIQDECVAQTKRVIRRGRVRETDIDIGRREGANPCDVDSIQNVFADTVNGERRRNKHR